MKKVTKKVLMSFSFPESTKEKLQRISSTDHVSMTEILRQLIEGYYDSEVEDNSGSADR